MSPLEEIRLVSAQKRMVRLFIKRDDVVHPIIQGNKWRKMRYLLDALKANGARGILTYGGAFSNHLHAVAAAGKLYGLDTAGIVRGKYIDLDNPTLSYATAQGMQVFPVSKKEYDAKNGPEIEEIRQRFAHFYHLPEGGATAFAVKGCAEIADEILLQLQMVYGAVPEPSQLYVCVPAGTGSTAAGIATSWPSAGKVCVFQAAKDGVLLADIKGYMNLGSGEKENVLMIEQDFTFGGFARMKPELMDFVHKFKRETGILLDPVYTSKMVYGVCQLLEEGFFPENACVVLVHTGGLQGWGKCDLFEKID